MKNPHAQALGKLGGQVSTKATQTAAKENGKKGGRPKHCKKHNRPHCAQLSCTQTHLV